MLVLTQKQMGKGTHNKVTCLWTPSSPPLHSAEVPIIDSL